MGMKLFFKYEWDDHKKKFVIIKGESYHRMELSKESRRLVELTIKDITARSGLTSKTDMILTVSLWLTAITLYICSFFLIRSQQSFLGMLLLGVAPFISFSIFVVKVIRGKRFDRMMKYLDESDMFYKEMLAPANLDLSYYFFESNI